MKALQKGDKFAAIFGVQSAGLSRCALAVALVLIWHANAKTGRCDPSIARLARETGQSERNVARAIKELEREGIIAKARHGGGKFTNAYAVQWSFLRELYQNWLAEHGLAADTPDRTVTPPLTELADTPDRTVTQTIEKQKKRTKEGDRSSSSSLNRDDASRLGYQGVNGVEAVNPLSFLAKPKTPSSEIVAREKAQQRFDEDLRKHLPAETYAEFIGRVDGPTVEKSITAEVARRGAGVRVALKAMNGGGHD